MTFDRIDRMVREANPVPDPSLLEPIDASDLQDQWRNEVQIEKTIEKSDRRVPDLTARRRPNRRWVAALGAVAAIVVAAGVILPNPGGLLGGDSPQAVAERYIAARAALDVEAAVAELSPDVTITDVPHVDDLGDVSEQFAYMEALEFKMDDYACSMSEEAMETEPVAVTCSYVFTTNLGQALDVEPIEDGSFTLLVEDGEIVRLFHAFNLEEYSSRVFEVFIGWLDETHPGVVDTMWSVAPGRNILMFDVTDENLADLERYIVEFEEAQS